MSSSRRTCWCWRRKGIAKIIEGLMKYLSQDFPVRIALETMAGKGTECGRNFDEIATIIDGVHIMNDYQSVLILVMFMMRVMILLMILMVCLNEFDKIIGKDRISVIHVNDSKNERGAMKDRHENIGFGHIGFEALNFIVHHPEFKAYPKIFETPFVGADPKNKIAPYKFEIEMFKSNIISTR